MTDLHVGKGGRIYLDGNLIDRVLDLRVDVDQYGRSTVTMEFQPTSVIYGDLPQPVVEEVLDAHTPVRKGQGVDMERAMENARRRARGEPVGAPVKDVPKRRVGPRGEGEMGSE